MFDVDPPQLHACWWSMRKLNLFFGFGWYVTRPRYESYHSQRPLRESNGRSTHGSYFTTSRSAPGGDSSVFCPRFQ